MRARRSKFGAIRTTVDGITFASKAEARRYQELRLLEKAGQVYGLECQPRFWLLAPRTEFKAGEQISVSGATGIKIGEYVADFRYRTSPCLCDSEVVEDVKGVRTALYKWKKKHCEAQYGIEIVEVTS